MQLTINPYTKRRKLPKRKHPVTNGRVARLDPSRTITLRRQFQRDLSRRFDGLRRAIIQLIVKEDALGLKRRKPFTFNATNDEGEEGRWITVRGNPVFIPEGRDVGEVIKERFGEKKGKSGPGLQAEKIDRKHYQQEFDYAGQKYTVNIWDVQDDMHGGRTWGIVFGIGAKDTVLLDMTKSGKAGMSAVGIFRRVGSVVDDFILKENPDRFHFASEKLHKSRVELYDKLSMFLAKRHGYSLHTTEDNVERVYWFDRKPIITTNIPLEPFNISFDCAFKVLTNAEGRWQFHSAEQKLVAFREWIKRQVQLRLIGEHLDEHAWWNRYIMDGFRRGAARAFDDTRPQVKEWQDSPEAKQRLDFYNGTREEFLRSSFNWPVSKEKVKLLASRTFTDLKGVTDGMAARISHTLVDGLTKGDNPRVIARELAKNVNISKTRAVVIARTEVIRTHAEGQLDAFQRMGVTHVGVMAEWLTAEDERVCPKCKSLNGVVLKVEEATGLLPRHPNCLPGDSLVLSRSRIAATSERWYAGDMIVINTASGRELSCTPNHPILTNLGWVPAKSLDIGSYVVRDGGREWESIGDNQDDHVPTCIEKIASAFGESGEVSAAEVPLSTPDFHGDAADGQVAVIRANSRLLLDHKTFLRQQAGQLYLNMRDVVGAGSFLGQGVGDLAGKRSRFPSDSVMSSPCLSSSLADAHPGPLEKFRLVLSPYMYPLSLKYATDYTPADLESIRNLRLSFSADIELDDDFVAWASSNLSILPTLDKVVSINFRRYDGHVYNLQTGMGWYSSNGIITHNCRCCWTPANVGEDESDQKRTKGSIERAIDESYGDEDSNKSSWGGADKAISRARPKSVLNVLNRSFFVDCERDRQGHCLPGSGQAETTTKERPTRGKKPSLLATQRKALAKAKAALASLPSKEEVALANKRIDEMGADQYESNIRGNSMDRKRSRLRLLAEFGDGRHCPCTYCGIKLDEQSVTRDKILTAREGGRYQHKNLVPACLGCNQSRGDVPWKKIKWAKR